VETVDPVHPEPAVLDRALRVIGAGDLLIYPTDTLYALGGLAGDPAVASKVRAAKGREEGKPFPLIAADVAQVEALVGPLSGEARLLAGAFWPGPLTLVLALTAPLPPDVSVGTVAVRVPSLPLARVLCRLGPLISTSANPAGEPPPLTCRQAILGVGDAAGLALDGGEGSPAPSTIVSVASGVARVVRPGAVSEEAVRRVLRGADC
jgi:L-threonylcarbamoyladenylate synthase